MFDDLAFKTWPLIIAGALVFAGLFSSVALLSEMLFDGAVLLTPRVAKFGLAAFIGYVSIAALLRHQSASSGKDD